MYCILVDSCFLHADHCSHHQGVPTADTRNDSDEISSAFVLSMAERGDRSKAFAWGLIIMIVH